MWHSIVWKLSPSKTDVSPRCSYRKSPFRQRVDPIQNANTLSTASSAFPLLEVRDSHFNAVKPQNVPFHVQNHSQSVAVFVTSALKFRSTKTIATPSSLQKISRKSEVICESEIPGFERRAGGSTIRPAMSIGKDSERIWKSPSKLKGARIDKSNLVMSQ
jgi:hypothetical protein